MIANVAPLNQFFAARRQRGEALVLATIIETIGSTYRKAGAQMLIAADGQAAGLLSGGCAESDLIERAQRVIGSGRAEIATFDTRGSDDVIWGIGLGCEGAMRILLTRIDQANNYQPFTYIVESKSQHRRGAFAFNVDLNAELGAAWIANQERNPPLIETTLQSTAQSNQCHTGTLNGLGLIFTAPIELPPRLLILGAGADAVPVVDLASRLGWQVVIADHRPAYAVVERFPGVKEVVLSPANELRNRLAINEFDAAVVMSHHLTTDQIYLAMLSESTIRYIGLLGPANRRQRLLAEIGDRAHALKSRLAGPVGLDIGAQTPESIALAIVAEIHAYLAGRTGSSFSGLLSSAPHDE